MITFREFGKHGRLGNQLFQWASLMGLSATFGQSFKVPKWKYSKYFLLPPDEYTTIQNRGGYVDAQEKHYFFDLDQWSGIQNPVNINNVTGWLQTEKYWQGIDVRKRMQFVPDHIRYVHDKYEPIFEAGAPIIAISVRRGDYVDNANYYQLPIEYYLLALEDEFPGWRDTYNVMVFTDDFDYCRFHFGALSNFYFAEGDAMEQLCAMSMCDHFIISNSTFSWWGAYLGEKEGSRIVRPAYHFAGDMLDKNPWHDYYPERWIEYDHMDEGDLKIGKVYQKRFDLQDVTFTIPYMLDHTDRSENRQLVLDFLGKHFKTTGISERVETVAGQFHRTKILNDYAQQATTPIIVNWDTDVLCTVAQILEAVHCIRIGVAEMVYPYDGRFARVPREDFKRLIRKDLDLAIFQDKQFRGTLPGDTKSVGGAIFWKKETFVRIGMENENFIDYGPEDVERFVRAEKMGVKIERIPGILFHFDHYIAPNSQKGHPHFDDNNRELKKVERLTKKQLAEYVATWPWLPMYRAEYYDSFSEDATQSAQEVFKYFFGMETEPRNVIDIGCGVGEWGHGLARVHESWQYWGIDHNIPLEKLLVPQDRFIDLDLMQDITEENAPDMPMESFDVALCMEVAEHLPAERADFLVLLLCKLAPVVLFSAAVPHQQGVGHVNEQWQTYWAKKFMEHGFQPYQLRHILDPNWLDNEKIELWYRQNTVLYIKGEPGEDCGVIDYVHPEMYLRIIKHYKKHG